MSLKFTPQSVLHQIAQIHQMEKGTLNIIRHGPNGPYYNHQCYEHGKNVSRYVPRDQVQAFQAALEGYQRFQTLVEQYVDLMVEKTRTERASDSKKNPGTAPGSKPGNSTAH